MAIAGDQRRFDVEPLPPFASASGAALEALPSLAPPARVLVSEAAPRRYVEVNGAWQPWRADVVPYMVEPMDVTGSRRFNAVVFVGPARSGKSDALVMSTVSHRALMAPQVMAVFSATRDMAREWSEGALAPMIFASPDLDAALQRRGGGNNMFGKRFRNGARLTIDWPVKTKVMQRSIGLGIATDYDAFPLDIEGDGEFFPLLRKRGESYGSRAMTVIESSPRHPVLDEEWSPDTAHEAPPCHGILGHYNDGSRARLYWKCPDCAEKFEPRFDRLRYPEDGSPAERGASAYMACPHCGSVIEHAQKTALNRASVWLHEDSDGSAVRLDDLRRDVATVSYWLPAPAVAFASWAQTVTRYLEAEARFAATGDESGLKSVVNVELGLPYTPRDGLAGVALSEKSLRDQASDDAWGECPRDTAFVTVAADVQQGRFVVQVEAWRLDLSRVVIDRFDLFTPPGDQSRALDPAKYSEDWAVLDDLAARVWPVRGGEYALRPIGVIVDCGGAPGVTPNAYAWWRRMRIAHPRRCHLVRGHDRDGARAKVARPETAHRGKKFAARDVNIIWAQADRLKDEVAASLTRAEDGARRLSVSRFAPANVFAEYAAERKTDKGWRKKPGVQRNEALDLSVYALALAIVLEAEAINRDRPPAWARPDAGNSQAVAQEGAQPAASPPKKGRKARIKKAKSEKF